MKKKLEKKGNKREIKVQTEKENKREIKVQLERDKNVQKEIWKKGMRERKKNPKTSCKIAVRNKK